MSIRTGYDPTFLGNGIEVPLPDFSLEIHDDILHKDELRDGYIVDYIHYSVVMSRSNRQAYFSAANLNQKEYKSVKGREWFVDSRIGFENQIGPEAYKKNPWDRGHLTRRTAVTWGDSSYVAKRASNDSCSYANSSLQHANFNQDEWRVPENVVQHFKKDLNDKICVFTGPIFTDTDRWYTRRNQHPPARIPSAFWKILFYIDAKTKKLACQAFLMYQDSLFIADKRGKYEIIPEQYQVTITEIERLTGLEFSEDLFQANPLYFFPKPNKNDGPEAFSIPTYKDIKDREEDIAFNRDEADKVPDDRKRKITEEEFEDYILNGKITVSPIPIP
jgi:endonuclease G